MENQRDRNYLPTVVLLVFIILGGFYYSVQINKKYNLSGNNNK